MTVLDTFAFRAHSPAMNKSAAIIAAVVASLSFASVAHANGDSEPTCGYDQTCETTTVDTTTTVVATDEPPVPTTTVSVPSTIGAINGPADVPRKRRDPAPFVCPGSYSGDVCIPPFTPVSIESTTTLEMGGDDCMSGDTTRWSMQPCDVVSDIGEPALPATGAGSEDVALVGLALLVLGGLLYGVRWAFKRD